MLNKERVMGVIDSSPKRLRQVHVNGKLGSYVEIQEKISDDKTPVLTIRYVVPGLGAPIELEINGVRDILQLPQSVLIEFQTMGLLVLQMVMVI